MCTYVAFLRVQPVVRCCGFSIMLLKLGWQAIGSSQSILRIRWIQPCFSPHRCCLRAKCTINQVCCSNLSQTNLLLLPAVRQVQVTESCNHGNWCSKVSHVNYHTESPSTKNDIVTDTSEEYTTIYCFRFMRYLHVLSRLKLAQTCFTVGMAPLMWFFHKTGEITETKAFCSVALATFALLMLYAMSYFLRRIVGFMYLHQNKDKVKIAHMDFWGRRQDQIVPVSDVVPLSETGERPTEHLLCLKRYSTHTKLYFTLKYGQVTDRKRFCEVFGDF